MNNTRKKVEELKKLVDEAIKEALEELDRLSRERFTWLTPRGLYRLYEELEEVVEDLEDALHEIKEDFKDVMDEAREKGEKDVIEELERLEEYIENRVREFIEKYRDFLKRVEAEYPWIYARRARWAALSTLPLRLARVIGKGVEEAVKRALEEVERSLEHTVVVSSIRLREDDAKIIDELVEAGVFKSRSEAVAFFTHKGIEATRDWLEKVREHLSKIKELREEVRRELEKT